MALACFWQVSRCVYLSYMWMCIMLSCRVWQDPRETLDLKVSMYVQKSLKILYYCSLLGCCVPVLKNQWAAWSQDLTTASQRCCLFQKLLSTSGSVPRHRNVQRWEEGCFFHLWPIVHVISLNKNSTYSAPSTYSKQKHRPIAHTPLWMSCVQCVKRGKNKIIIT